MLNVAGIEKIEKESYEETIISGEDRWVRVAPILGFYNVCFLIDGDQKYLEAEVRPAQGDALQISWDDDFHDFLVDMVCSQDELTKVAETIHSITWPVRIK
jgi:hypothetical protein